MVGSFLAVIIVVTSIFATRKYEKPAVAWRAKQEVFSLRIPEKLFFAEERVPL